MSSPRKRDTTVEKIRKKGFDENSEKIESTFRFYFFEKYIDVVFVTFSPKNKLERFSFTSNVDLSKIFKVKSPAYSTLRC
jgi:hypothetical protein